MTNPVGSFIWYELMTTDPDAARDFYGQIVGWKIVGEAPAGGGFDYRHIVRDDGGSGGGVLYLDEAMCNGGARPGWLGYLYVADVDATAATIVADGGKVIMPKTTIDVGSFALIADPQGVPIYIMTPIPPAGVEDATSDVWDREAPQRVSWNELYTPDLAAAKAFYAKHFNFEFNESLPMGPMGDYCFIDVGGNRIGAMMQKPDAVPVGMWNYYIRVPEIDAAVARLKELGGQVFNGPMAVPGDDWVINGMDPQGAMVSLCGKKGG